MSYTNLKENSGLTLSDLTTNIVKNREKSRNRFATQEEELLKIQKSIKKIRSNFKSELWGKIISESSAEKEWAEIINATKELSNRLDSFMAETGLFYLAKSRADRVYVNVGSVGVTQEGKSEFNARVAKLDQRILPRGGGSESCTTARINIINGTSPDGKTDIVRVHYYTVNGFANLLYSYLIELGAEPKEYKYLCTITTKDELNSWVADYKLVIQEATEIGKDKLCGQKVAFLKYLTNIGEYINNLGKAPKDYTFKELTSGKEDDKAKAEEYYSSVSYFSNPDDKTIKYTSYATEKAEVFTSFKVGNEDPINNLQFLDTPGIGEAKPGLERILAKSVSSDLDVIMVIRAARSDVQGDPTRTQLIPQLRALLNKRPYSQQSLYFVLNVWNQAKPGTGDKEKEKIKDELLTAQNNDKIVLDDSHFKVINILKGVEILSNGSTNSNNPIHGYLLKILKQLIPNMENIDNEFFKDAEDKYAEIENDYRKIKIMVANLSYKLPNEDLTGQIDDVFAKVAKEWKKESSTIDDKTIIGQIQCDLEKFCNQETGYILSELLGIPPMGIEDFDEEEDNYEFINKFCIENAKAINEYVDKPSWNAGAELKCYAELKSKLLNKIENVIFSYIHVEKAQEELSKAKYKLADVFRLHGKLNFVSDSSENWWQNMAQLLENEKYSEELTTLFTEFASFSIDYHNILKKSIEKVIQEGRHADNFGTPEFYFFSDWESAKKAIIHSLLCIEYRVQSLVEEDVYKDELGKVVSLVYTYINKLRELNTFGEQDQKTKLREAWELFYKKHAKEIFADNEQEQKRALVTDWNKLID